MSPLLKSANDAGIAAINQRNAPWTYSTKQWFEPAEELRSLFAKIIKSNVENIALIPSASYGIAVAKKNIHLKSSQNIIVLNQEYPSNFYAWRELSKETGATINIIKKEEGKTWAESILPMINDKTGLVAIPNCHWTDGGFVDLVEISKKARQTGAKLVIDASQSAGAYPLDINKIKPDFLITVGYKWLLGPYGLGYLYADDKYFNKGKPIEFSWLNKKGSEDFAKLIEYTDEFKPGAKRFDAGGYPSFIHIPMAIAALKQILEWGVENIQETLSLITKDIICIAKEHGIDIPASNSCVGHMIGIKVNEAHALGKKLADNQIYISVRGTNLRIAPHLYNTIEDVKKLFNFF